MKALVLENSELGFVEDYPEPLPAGDEAMVRVSLAGICATDLEIVKGYMGFAGVPGHEFVGVVEAAGDAGLAGKRVVGEINCCCGDCDYCRSGQGRHCPERSVLGIMGRGGAFAEYLTLPVANLHQIPDTVTDEDAVFVEPLAAAFEILEQVDIVPNDAVCVLGDGRLGLLVAQVLSLHTSSLLAVGKHPKKQALLAERGIETATATQPGARFDIVVDCTGAADGLQQAAAMVKPRGTVILKTTVTGERPLDLNRLVIDEITMVGSRCGPFEPAIDALAQGTVAAKPLISKKFPLEQGVEAFSYARQDGVLKVLLQP